MNAFRVPFLLGKVVPLVEVERLKRTVSGIEHDLRAALEQERQRPACRADIDRLPEAVEHEDLTI